MRANTLIVNTLSLLLASTTVWAAQPAAIAPSAAPQAQAAPAAVSPTPSAVPSNAIKVADNTSSAADTANPSANSSAATAAAPANAQQQQIETTVHQYLIKKPEVVVEALQAYQQKQMESMQQLFKDTQKMAPKYADILFHQDNDPVGGNVKGKVTVVEFSDYQCSHCIESSPVLDATIKADPNLRVVVKEFPIRGAVSEAAARAALAANKQGKYWQFRDALFQNGASLTQDKIFDIAKNLGLDVAKLKKDMEDPAIRKMILDNQKLAQNLKLVGTPAFFVAKSDIKVGAPETAINYIPGVVTQPQLQTIIGNINNNTTASNSNAKPSKTVSASK